MKTIQAMINCDLPGHRTIQYDTGSGFSSAQVSGWLPFKDYVAALSALLPNSWTLSYNETTDRVSVTAGSGSLTLRFESQSMADTLGSSSATTSAFSSSGDLGSAPYGLTPIKSLHISDPVSGNTPSLRVFRHGRAHSTAYGSAKNYRVSVRFEPSNFARLQEGPCGVGKVRMGDYTASSVYSSSALGGYLDGYILNQTNISLENLEVGLGGSASFEIVSPVSVHNNSGAVSDAFWGHIDRGYSLNYFAEIEGLPFRLLEKDVGFSSGNYTDSASLVIDDSQKVQYKIDRFKGLSGASGVTLGVLDPDNSLGIFQRASVQIAVSEDVDYNDTTITLAKDSTNFGSGGVVYLGKEALRFSGNTGPSGSPANQLGGVNRYYGPGYDYKKESIQKFRTVSNKKRVWDGCEVDLRAMLLDPYGRAVGTTYTDDYQRKIFSGEVEGLPGYDGGVWVIQTRDLIRRLARKIGFGSSGRTAPAAPQNIANLTGLTLNEFSGLWVKTLSTDEIVADIQVHNGAVNYSTISTINLSSAGLPTYHTLGEGINKILNSLLATALPNSDLVSEQISILHDLSSYKIDDSGMIFFSFVASQPSGFFYIVENISFETSTSAGATAPMWLPQGVVLWDRNVDSSTSGQLAFRSTGMQGTTSSFVVLKQPPNTSADLGGFSGSGFAVLEGDNGVNELIRYTGTDTSSIPHRTILSGVTRNLMGQSVNIFKGEREVSEAVRQGTDEQAITGTVGSLAANVLESSGNTSQRGTFDVLPRGFGYALTASDHVYDNPLTLQDPSKTIAGGLNIAMDLVLTGGLSFVDYFGGLAAALGMCFSWVRSGSGLRIGLVRTSPSGNLEAYTITDDDLLHGSSASIQRVAVGPNEIKVEQSESPLLKGKSQYTYRIIEDMLSRGTVSQSVKLYGMQESVFFNFAKSLAASMVNSAGAETAYKLKVKPSRDWLPGQLIRVNVSNPSIYDWKGASRGLNDLARIMEVSRDLSSGECEITIVSGATVYFPTLCPAVLVTGYTTSGGNGILTVSDSSWFEASDVARVYNPGMGIEQEAVILSVNSGTNQITLNGLLGFAPTNGFTTVSYPKDDNASITAKQLSHCHVEDGGSWL